MSPRLRGRAQLVRYADDFVIVFAREDDARRVMDVLPKRLAKYGLTMHPTKTRLILVPSAGARSSRKGRWVVKRKTASGRFARALKRIATWCRLHRHHPVREQHRHVSQAVRGHNGYFGIIGSSSAIARFADRVSYIWMKWLQRRSERGVSQERVRARLRRFPLPPPRITQRGPFLAANP